jgi:hypothetical protein
MEDGSTSIENVTVTQDTVGINLVKALCKVQEEITNPIAEATNPFFKSKYATLSSILNLVRPLLSKNGLYLYQNAGNDENYVYIETKLIHTSGEYLQSSRLYLKPDKKTPQGIGSTITYGRRYQLAAVLGICDQDDDDGNAAESNDKSQPKNNSQNKPTPPKRQPKSMNKPEFGKDELKKLRENNGTIDAVCGTLEVRKDPLTKMTILKEANVLLNDDSILQAQFNQVKKDLGMK